MGTRFRLIDLFAVVMIGGLLIALLMPALEHRSRTPSKRSICSNHQRMLALAFQNHDNAHNRYPGYTNFVGDRRAPWLVRLLPYLEQQYVSDAWESTPLNQSPPTPAIPLMLCPSDARAAKGPFTSFVANAGMAGMQNEAIANGMLHNAAPNPNDRRVRGPFICAAQVVDGTSCTLILSENRHATTWDDLRPGFEKQATVFVWHPLTKPKPIHRINGPAPKNFVSDDTARPSGGHRGGVLAAYVDGHVGFLSDQLGYQLYQQLMTTNDAKSAIPNKSKLLSREEMAEEMR
jgi:hypothetical protein